MYDFKVTDHSQYKYESKDSRSECAFIIFLPSYLCSFKRFESELVSSDVRQLMSFDSSVLSLCCSEYNGKK